MAYENLTNEEGQVKSNVLPPLGQVTYDAVVASEGGDFTTLYAALNAGKRKIFIRQGTYSETPIAITTNLNGLIIHGIDPENTILQYTAVTANNYALEIGSSIGVDNCEIAGIQFKAVTGWNTVNINGSRFLLAIGARDNVRIQRCVFNINQIAVVSCLKFLNANMRNVIVDFNHLNGNYHFIDNKQNNQAIWCEQSLAGNSTLTISNNKIDGQCQRGTSTGTIHVVAGGNYSSEDGPIVNIISNTWTGRGWSSMNNESYGMYFAGSNLSTGSPNRTPMLNFEKNRMTGVNGLYLYGDGHYIHNNLLFTYTTIDGSGSIGDYHMHIIKFIANYMYGISAGSNWKGGIVVENNYFMGNYNISSPFTDTTTTNNVFVISHRNNSHPTNYTATQETRATLAKNASGGTLNKGDVVVYKLQVTAQSGAFAQAPEVTTTTTKDDNRFAGIVLHTANDGQLVWIATKGLAPMRVTTNATPPVAGTFVGTATTVKEGSPVDTAKT